MTGVVDLHAALMELAPGGRHQFEVTADDWWLTQDGRRCHDQPWHPQDQVDVLIAATLLHMLNDAGPIKIPAEYHSQRMSDERLRERLMLAAYSLYVRQLRRRIGPPRP